MITQEQLIESVYKKCLDPELLVDVWTIGLIYETKITEEEVNVRMTFTSPFCPYGPQLVEDLKHRIKGLGAKKVDVEITFEPPWKPSEELKEMLGMSG